jgi:hypothetical protein
VRNRCGAPLPEVSDKRRRGDTCRKFVAVAGTRCYLHRAPLPAYDDAMRKVFG